VYRDNSRVRALITGAAGQLGSDLGLLLPEAVKLDHATLDIRNRAAVAEALDSTRPDVVFNCAAYNAVDAAEDQPEVALNHNALGPSLLAEACRRAGSRLVHFSTNYVFAGDASDPYTEDDPPGPLSAYGMSKLRGEQAAIEALPSVLVIRSAGLFGVRGSAVKGGSFPERVIARARAGEQLRVVCDQRLNPTFTRHLAQAAIAYVEGGMSGVVHAVAEGCCTFSELAREALRLAGIAADVQEITTAELAAKARRPLNGCLASVRVEPLRPWQEGLAEWSRES
jgi:dTDP-4-dehydrorhamnose reductase